MRNGEGAQLRIGAPAPMRSMRWGAGTRWAPFNMSSFEAPFGHPASFAGSGDTLRAFPNAKSPMLETNEATPAH